MTWRDIEKARMSASGETAKEQYVRAMISFMDSSFDNSSDVGIVLLQSSTPYYGSTPSYTEVEARIIAKTGQSSVVDDDKRKLIFRNPDYEANEGQVYVFENKNWLVTKTHTNTVPKSCYLERVNHIAKIVDRNGNYYEFPSVIKYRNSELNHGRSNDRVLVRIPNDRIQMTIPYRSDLTSIVHYAPKWTRILFNGQAFHVESLDVVTDVIDNKGLAHLLLVSDMVGPYDDLVNGIANRYYPTNISIEVLNGDSIEIETGETLQLNIVVREDDNIISSPAFSVESNSDSIVVTGNSLSAITSGEATITIKYGNATKSIIVSVVETVEDSFTIVVNGEDTLYLGQTSEYKAIVSNNGKEDSSHNIVWSIVSDDGETTNLATIVLSGNKVNVIANNKNLIGYIRLIAKLQSDNSIVGQKRIRIRSII